jgi:hypothetical protein
MSAPAGDPAYDPNTWKIGYQTRQSGVAGPDVLPAMAFPPTAMVAAAGAEVTPKE